VYPLDEIRAQVEGPFRVAARWTLGKDTRYSGAPFIDSPPKGYEQEMSIEATVTLRQPTESPSENSAWCADVVQFPAVVEVATTDGAIASATLSGYVRYSLSTRIPELVASTDLIHVRGGLELQVDPAAHPTGQLYLKTAWFPDGLHGQLGLTVNDAMPFGGTARDYFISAAWWPSDECGPAGFRVERETAQAWADGASFADIYEEWRTTLEDLGPMPARWLDDSKVDVRVLLDPEVPERLCLQAGGFYGVAGPDSGLVYLFQSQTQLVTSDGRVDATLLDGALSRVKLLLESGEQDGEPVAIDDLEQRSGIKGVNVAGSPELSASFKANFLRDNQEIEGSGLLNVYRHDEDAEYGSRIDCLEWPRMPPEGSLCTR
jgi:hypothetical protein